jgi:ribose transport system ATP-binding protein
MLQLSGIRKQFGPTVALDGVDLLVQPGEVHALIGENGAGKSTLMNVLAGEVQPEAGTMTLDGQPYAPAAAHQARQHGIALIHQELSLCPHLSVAENILLGCEPARSGWLDRAAMHRRATDVLAGFAHPEITPERRVADLPLAARQIVEICRALAAEARIILMDEPTSSLPRDDVAHLFALIRQLCASGIAIVYISHFLEEVREVATCYTVLRDGRSVDTGRIDDVTDAHLIARMVGRPMTQLFPERRPQALEEVLLAVRDLAAPPALQQATFEVRAGEVLGIAGLMGAGRTEMVRALFGLDPAPSGTLVLHGTPLAVRGGTPARRLSQGLGYLSEDRKGEGLALALSLADNITLTRMDTCVRHGWLFRARQHAQAQHWIDDLGIRTRTATQAARTLSGGNQQKVALARLLHQDARVLLLDEPTRGIDIGSKAKVYEVIHRCAEAGKAVVLVSSYLPELFGVCDRLAVMCRGRLSEARPLDTWTPEAVMQAAIGG